MYYEIFKNYGFIKPSKNEIKLLKRIIKSVVKDEYYTGTIYKRNNIEINVLEENKRYLVVIDDKKWYVEL